MHNHKYRFGQDNILFGLGDGQDTINIQRNHYLYDTHKVTLLSPISPDDISFEHIGNDLILKINNTDDQILFERYFLNESVTYRFEWLVFESENLTWTYADITKQLNTGHK
ncbi:calcium-binding protein [Catenovulum sediminis]|uniref:Calcium-binding protein n=1 Tax=Catenovulum sediminis TaxID=1740262 RepID=A0ABV1REL1_9ALTE|nr:calcium-binding protein [Catenovulum sediminis]